MNIEQMVLRENIYGIIIITLKYYYKTIYNIDVEIDIKEYNLWDRVVIYPHLGSIMTRLPKRKILRYLLNEYNIRDNILKYIIAKLYVVGCFFSFGLLAGKALYISNKEVMDNSIAIIPSNRKIRIYNFQTGFVDAIIKDTFTRKYFDNELSFRLDSVYDFIPPIIEHGDDWYREEILPGQPLARIKDEKLYEKYRNQAVKEIKELSSKYIQYENAIIYSEDLYAEILEKMGVAKANKRINCYDMIIEIARAALAKAVLLEAPLPTVKSHGDLQSGNIWVDLQHGKTYIIDWETHARRSIWYDCATILMSIRRANRLKEMMDNCETEAVRAAVLTNDSRKNYHMQAVMGIITLEDIMFYLDDMLELPQDIGGDIFNRIALELDMMGWRKIHA